jgi:hypothetical protein
MRASIAQEKAVPERSQGVQSGKPEQRIGEIAVDILGRTEHRFIFGYAEVHAEYPQVEHPSVTNERNESQDRGDEHQRIKCKVHRAG